MTERILRQKETEALVGLSRTAIWRLEKSGDFPTRRRLAPNVSGFLLSELESWMRSRPPMHEQQGDDTDSAA